MIELKNVSKSYGKHQAVRDLSLTIASSAKTARARVRS